MNRESNVNIFKIFSTNYTKFIINKLNKSQDAITKSYIDSLYEYIRFNKYKSSKDEECIKLVNMYKEIESIITDDDIAIWFENLRYFGHFIRFAEKCFMYHNTDTSLVFSETIKDKPDDIIIYFKRNDYKVKIRFEKTEIPQIVDFTDNGYVTDGNVYFINIEIVRNFGKQMCNTFKFISYETPKFKDFSDQLLFEKFKKDISRDIKNVYDDILDSIIPNYTGITTTYWKEAIQDGLWIR